MFILNNRSGLRLGWKKKQQWFAEKSVLDMRKPLRKPHARPIFSLPTKLSTHIAYHTTIAADVVSLHIRGVSCLNGERLQTTCPNTTLSQTKYCIDPYRQRKLDFFSARSLAITHTPQGFARHLPTLHWHVKARVSSNLCNH